MVECIHYRSGYKYQLTESLTMDLEIFPDHDVETPFIALNVQGRLVLRRGYAWDGPSGPAVDTKNFMRASLIHDALYQLMRLEELDRDIWREEADLELHRLCREDGMTRLRAWWVLRGLRWFGDPAASPESRKREASAPRGCVDA